MSNRNFSFLKRFKTQKTERNNPAPARPSNKTPTSRLEKTNRALANEEKVWEKIQLSQSEKYIVKCVNHPLKKASFEPKQSLKQAYCQDCSLKLVQYNIRMVKMTERSLYLRALYQAQFQKLTNFQYYIRELVERHFEAQREIVRLSFLMAKQSLDKELSIPIFKPSTLEEIQLSFRLKELMGSVQLKKIEFVQCQEERGQSENEKLQYKQGNSKEQASGANKENMNRENFCGFGRGMRTWSKNEKKSACLR